MKTYQDLTALGEDDRDRADFVLAAVRDFQSGELYRTARDADAYFRHRNPSILRAQKIVYNLLGEATPDLYRPNHKIPCRYYRYFVTQEIQFLLGNGVLFKEIDKDAVLGRDFDSKVQLAARHAINGGMAFGFWNFDHLEVFPVYGGDDPSFCPLWDAETGALRAGIRWWQMDARSPIRLTLYEADGITEYIRRPDEDVTILQEKHSYQYDVAKSDATGVEIYGAGNYSTLPIVPFYNVDKQSEIVGGRETIDAYDLMVSGLVNNTDEGNLIYWVLKNANAMDEEDDARFLAQLRRTHVAHADGDDGVGIEHQIVEVPVDASEAAIDRLRRQLFDDFMALDVKEIAGGAATATQIRAAYEPLNQKVSEFEYQVLDFLAGVLALAGVEEVPTFRRDIIVNQSEEITNLMQAAQYLDADTVTEQVCGVLGLIDRVDEIIAKRKSEELGRYEPEPEEATV